MRDFKKGLFNLRKSNMKKLVKIKLLTFSVLLTLSSNLYGQSLEANFKHSIVRGQLTANFTDLSTPGGQINSWTWNFGDGFFSTLQNPSHTYASESDYLVKLTVTRGVETATYSKTISISNVLKAIFTVSANSGVAFTQIDFNSETSTGAITSQTWNITPGVAGVEYTYITGDRFSLNPTIRFNKPDVYTVTLQVNNGSLTNTSAPQYINIGFGVAADFNWATPAYEGRPIQFTDISQYPCSPSQRTWTFDSFSNSNAPSPSYTFVTAGTYEVKLCVVDACGNNNCTIKQVTIAAAINNLIPSFFVDKGVIRKGQAITFTDTSKPDPSTPQITIKWWSWWFEQPKDLTTENPVQDGQSFFYTTSQAQVSHIYNNAGTYKVRLYIGTALSGGLASDNGVYYEQIVTVKETPELSPGYSKQQNLPVTVNGGAAGVTMVDLALSGSKYAVLKNINGVNGAFPKTLVNVFDKVNEDNWALTGAYQNDPSSVTPSRAGAVVDIALKNGNLMLRLDNGRYLVNGSEIPSTNQSPFLDVPQFDIYGNEAVIVQNEFDGKYLYLITKGLDWSSSTSNKYLIAQTSGRLALSKFTGKVFIDQFRIVVQDAFDIYIYEKLNNTWDFSIKKAIRSNGSEPFTDFSYAGNTIIATGRPSTCPIRTWPIAYIYERPTNGWIDNMNPTATLYLDVDSDISDNTQICLDNKVPTTFQPDYVNISNKYSVVKVNLVNGSNLVTRNYVYKKFGNFWTDSNQTYKINNAEKGLPTLTSDTDLLNGLLNSSVNGKTEVYSYKNYCLLAPVDQIAISISGVQKDVVNGIIRLGDNSLPFPFSGVVINPGAKITYLATSITLRAGFIAKAGSTATFKVVATCDDLYFR
jgi:PKD repeat protein